MGFLTLPVCTPKCIFAFLFVWCALLLVILLQNNVLSWMVIPRNIMIPFRNESSTTPSGVKVRLGCVIPQLNMKDPTMMKTFKTVGKPTCAGEPNWVYVDNGTLRFSKKAVETHKSMECDYYPVLRDGDFKIKLGAVVKNVTDGFNITSDASKVACKGKDGKKYERFHHGVAFQKQFVTRAQDPLEDGFQGMSIAILGFDSMSRMSWLRRLPKTREYFVNKLGAIELESHNIVGDGTTAVMFPMLTGKFEWELPECRRGFKGAKPMDDFPWLWQAFQKAGYLTSWSNSRPDSAPFQWRMLGFMNQPTDFYARNFYVEAYRTFKGLCHGSRPRTDVWLQWFKDIFLMYKRQRKFLFHFITDFSHDDNNPIGMMDADIRQQLEFLYNNNYLNKTLFILMGDHGARYFQVRSTVPGKLEERLPYFSLLFPQWFQDKYPEAMRNLRTNTKRLTTPFDLHETFKEFLSFTGTGRGDLNRRSISLFKEIPIERTCKHAGIAPHWCACLDWTTASVKDDGVKKSLQVALDTINGYTSGYRDDCALLSVGNVTMATKLNSNSDLLKFKSTDSNGGIYHINLSSTQKDVNTLYQVTFYTSPGGGHFEVTVNHDLVTNKFSVSEKEISRINKYGNSPNCILQKNRQIRQYCYCKNNLKS